MSSGGAVSVRSHKSSISNSQDAEPPASDASDDDEDDYFEDEHCALRVAPAPVVGRSAAAAGAAAAANAVDDDEVFSQIEQQKAELEQRLGLERFVRAYEAMQVSVKWVFILFLI